MLLLPSAHTAGTDHPVTESVLLTASRSWASVCLSQLLLGPSDFGSVGFLFAPL
jgi:hypothetical protein